MISQRDKISQTFSKNKFSESMKQSMEGKIPL